MWWFPAARMLVAALLILVTNLEQVGAFSLTVTESHIEATAGQSVYFLVMPSEQGSFTITWTVNTSSTIASAQGTAVKYFGDYQGRAELYPNNATLRLDTVTPADSGSYSVIVFELSHGTATAALQLRVHTPVSNVSISLSPDKEIFIENKDTATLRCTAMGSFPTYSWALDGNPLPLTPRYTLSADNSTLTISPVHRSDSGGFICTASHLVGSDSSKPVKLVITYGPDPPTVEVIGLELCGSLFSGHYCGKEGDLVTLNCQTKCFPECNYRWTHNTAVIAGNTSQLPIESLTFQSSGDYTCNVESDYTTISRTEKVSILVYRAPTQQITCGAADKGTALVLMCSWAGGVPDTVLQLKVGQTIVIETNEGNVTITKDQLSSREIFTCVGRHVVSDSQCSIVIDKPQRASGSEPQVEVGKEADVTLDVSLTDTVRVSDPGLLPAHFTWSKEDNSITGSDGKFNITSGLTFSKLLISKFQATDQGTYQCRVTNAMGENFFQFDVTLKGGVNVALIVGTIVGAVAVVVIATLAVVYVYRKRKEAKTQQETEGEPHYETIDVRASSANVSQKDSGPYMDLGKHQKDIYHNLRRNGTRK
ncbi:V-set and immunoglobulin domain-containing protein 10-like [Callorhinchus milii]|uniref:V-set and immunoglobulin domain-containing protein 10-like n=1 Tax=Callorhinchus milii TaxID=7868 RepID=UPI001C3F593D|nr:V-set and immunoglobulin domain-containing protein 10-like [Callorhinchus milii]